ncbi:metal-sulfur cluster assembly factor [Xanthobacter flavus]|uniref:metal-sulfur cluster assembly factor n=1 Tax=Xanthobacter flavus TaxID=281 RepID=UPI001AE480A6|nr:iron-sulfur cluster assembly protein [Xanthobacter flavus]MBP2150896.1 metal-sulfur cluster biosynthetic enzyme [Xanthobacter flavus]
MTALLEARVRAALTTVMDPEMGLSLMELGLIYALEVSPAGSVHVLMTTTTRGCPLAGILREMVEAALAGVDGVTAVGVELTYEPAWTPDMIRSA